MSMQCRFIDVRLLELVLAFRNSHLLRGEWAVEPVLGLQPVGRHDTFTLQTGTPPHVLGVQDRVAMVTLTSRCPREMR